MQITRKYHAWNAKAQTWDYIENRYIEDFRGAYINSFVQLVRHIKSSSLSKRLFGLSSMDRLIVCNHDDMEFGREALYITFDLQENVWHFEYHAERYRKPEFVRTYPAEKGIEKFDNFIKMIRW